MIRSVNRPNFLTVLVAQHKEEPRVLVCAAMRYCPLFPAGEQ